MIHENNASFPALNANLIPIQGKNLSGLKISWAPLGHLRAPHLHISLGRLNVRSNIWFGERAHQIVDTSGSHSKIYTSVCSSSLPPGIGHGMILPLPNELAGAQIGMEFADLTHGHFNGPIVQIPGIIRFVQRNFFLRKNVSAICPLVHKEESGGGLCQPQGKSPD